MNPIIPLLAIFSIIPLTSNADICDNKTTTECHDHLEGLTSARTKRLGEPTLWIRAPYNKKFTYRTESEGLDAEAEAEMIRREDERNGY